MTGRPERGKVTGNQEAGFVRPMTTARSCLVLWGYTWGGPLQREVIITINNS